MQNIYSFQLLCVTDPYFKIRIGPLSIQCPPVASRFKQSQIIKWHLRFSYNGAMAQNQADHQGYRERLMVEEREVRHNFNCLDTQIT
jgi:hypothetical protein